MINKVAEVELKYKPTKQKRERITTSDDAYQYLRKAYDEDTIQYKEYFKVLLMNCKGEALGWTCIAEGGLTQTPVDIRLIFQAALLANATTIILSHNHPSGSVTPSSYDKELTNTAVNAGKLLNIRVADHLILSQNNYYSFNNNGEL